MARKKGLPFVVQPRLKPVIERIGSEESGVFEIERRGYLSVAEKAIAQQASGGDDSVRQLYVLAGRIARETGRQQAQVVTDLSEQERPEYLEAYDEEIISAMVNMVEFNDRLTIIQATALLICRIDSEWSVEQTMELHPDILADLSRLFIDEDNKSIDALERAQEESEGGTEGK